MYMNQPLMYTITRPAAKIDVAKMAVKTSFVYAVAVIVFTCVYNVYGQQGATPAPCTTSYLGDYQCNDGNGCYDEKDKCDFYNVCSDKSDDLNCDSCTDTLSFYCPSSRQCVRKRVVCNGDSDCLNGEDEDVTFCSTRCMTGYGDYQCNDGNGCYSDYDKCNSYNACVDKTDELNCDRCTGTLSFHCPSSRQCVFTHSVCDGNQDCTHGEDENLPECNPTIWMYWTGGQMAGIVIGYVIFLVIVIAIVVVVHKNCKK